jgi:hypothetical protein
MRDLIKFIREEFYAELETKTGWGREELKLAFERAIANGTIRASEAQERG